MKKLLKYFALAAICAATTALEAKEIRLLTIGNSFADSAFVFLPSVTESVKDCKIDMEKANHGGCELKRHWSYVEQEESGKNVKKYRKNSTTLKNILKSKKWDFVTIQQASHQSWIEESYQPYAKNLAKYVSENAPTAEIVIQQTWAYRADDPRISKDGKWGFDQNAMFERLEAAYAKCAKEMNLRVIPTGKAVQNARAQQENKFVNYDASILKTIQYPQIPDQNGALVGRIWWKTNPDGTKKIARDTIHLNVRGQYLQACVWFGFLFDKNPEDIKFVPDELKAEDAKFLRKVAAQTLKEFKQPRE